MLPPGPSTLGRIDDLLGKFAAVFLFPIVNLICISFIVYWCTRGFNISGLMQNVHLPGDGSEERLGFVTKFVRENLSVITEITSAYRKEIASLSFVMAVTTSVLLVLVIYLFDRVTFYVGYLMPPVFNFDIDAYGRAPQNANDANTVRTILGTDHSLGLNYGIIRAYLGDKNTNADRIAYRAKLMRSLDSTNTVIAYVKSYVLLTAVLLLYSLFFVSPFSRLPTFLVLVLISLVLAAAVYYFSLSYRRLVDFDVTSFVWERCYNNASPFEAGAIAAMSESPERSRLKIGPWYLIASLFSRDAL
jgi:hypothetical protein